MAEASLRQNSNLPQRMFTQSWELSRCFFRRPLPNTSAGPTQVSTTPGPIRCTSRQPSPAPWVPGQPVWGSRLQPRPGLARPGRGRDGGLPTVTEADTWLSVWSGDISGASEAVEGRETAGKTQRWVGVGRRWAHSRTPTPAGEGNGYHQECQGGTGRENGARSPSGCKGKSEEPGAALPAASQTQCPFSAAEGPRCPDLWIPLIPRDGQQEERPSLWADAPAFPLRPGGIRRPDPISLGTAFSLPSSSPSSAPRVKSQGTLTPPARSPGGPWFNTFSV